MKNIITILVLILFCTGLQAQKVFIDKPLRVGDIICFPSVEKPHNYYYVPDKPHVAVKNGKPQFSFTIFKRIITSFTNRKTTIYCSAIFKKIIF